MEYLLGIDIGTSGTKSVLYDRSGAVMASSLVEYPMLQPQNGWAEERPEDWWEAAVRTIRAVLQTSGIQPSQICGVGLSGQMHSLVMLDRNLEVLRPAILWCDGRTGAQCAEITRRVGPERLIRISANPALTGFTAGKILWVRQNEPELYARCRHILLPKDYIRLKLTGVLASDVSDASGTNLLDVGRRRWSRELVELLDIDPALLPPLLESCAPAGSVCREAASRTGLAEGTLVVAGAADNAASAVGTGVVTPGSVFHTLGTSGVIFAHTDHPATAPGGRVHTICAAVPNGWAFMSCTLAAGLSLRWFRDTFCAEEVQQAGALGIDSYVYLDRLAAAIPAGSGGLLFLPYLMGERSPVLDERCRGVFFGLSAGHTKAHLLRAVMEGVAYSQRSCLTIFRALGLQPEEIKVCGGGGRSPLWRQILADQFHLPVRTMASAESPTLGAAILAATGAGLYPDLPTACGRMVRCGNTLETPGPDAAVYDAYAAIYERLYGALHDEFAATAAKPADSML